MIEAFYSAFVGFIVGLIVGYGFDGPNWAVFTSAFLATMVMQIYLAVADGKRL